MPDTEVKPYTPEDLPADWKHDCRVNASRLRATVEALAAARGEIAKLCAALAGAPSDSLNLPFVPWSKEREMVASWKGVDNDRRALAEKVREACAEVCDRLHQMVLSGAGEPQLGQRTAQAARMVRALNIDELLKESA